MSEEILRGIIFDLDGVIVDTAKFHYIAWRSLAHRLGFDFSEEQNEQLKGVSRVRSLEILLDIGKIDASEEEKSLWAEEKNAEYLQHIKSMTDEEILPGALELIKECKAEGMKIALGSASKNAPTILDVLGITDLFDSIVDGNRVTKAKPDPEVFLLAAKEIDIEPLYCVVLEDAVAGIKAANSAGMVSIGIGDSHTLMEAHMVYPDLEKINCEVLKTVAREKL